MKYFLAILFICFLFFGKSQTYYPTGLDSTTYSLGCFNLSSGSHSTWIEQYTFKGDTIINGKSYRKVYYSDDDNIDTSFDVASTNINYRYIFAVRDSSKKVFTLSANQSTEKLVYDFNLSVGDTMRHYLSHSSASIGISILARIDSFLINYPTPHFRKKYFYTGQLNTSFNNFGEIEGLTTAFFGAMDATIRSGGCVRMVCVQQKETYIFRDCDTCDCYISMIAHMKASINENSFGKLKVFPNPFSDFINIDFEDLKAEGVINVLDISGRVIFEKQVNNSSTMKINLSDIPSGVYFISMQINGQMNFAKIVKQE